MKRLMLMAEQILLTKQGFDKLKHELTTLETILQPKNAKRVKHAYSFCDFNEDSEYDAALREQLKIKQRIKELQHTLRHAKIIQHELAGQTITLGTTVEIIDLAMREKEKFTIVAKEEADPLLGKVSVESPLGEALINAEVNDELNVRTPKGMWNIKVNAIK